MAAMATNDRTNPSRRDEAERLATLLAAQLAAAADTWKQLTDVRYPETDEDIDPAAEDEDMVLLADSIDAAASATSHILEDIANEENDPYRTVCPECEGAGEVRHPRWGARNCPEPTIPCPYCAGAGEVSLDAAHDWDDEHETYTPTEIALGTESGEEEPF